MFTETLAECNTLKPKNFTAEAQRAQRKNKIKSGQNRKWHPLWQTLPGYLQVGADQHSALLLNIFVVIFSALSFLCALCVSAVRTWT
jgi:hypothetical protein